jgi:branched-chain amino acid transport system permease protein
MRLRHRPSRQVMASAAPDRAKRTLHRNVARISVLALLATIYMVMGNSSNLFLFNTCLLAGVAALALNLLMGTAGQPSLGTTAFLGLGAFSTIALMHQHVPFVLAALISALIAAIGGLVLGLPSLRMRGVYLALATLGAYFFMTYFGQQYQDSAAGPQGFVLQPYFSSAGPVGQQRYWCIVLLAVLAVVSILVEQLSSGRIGRALRMIRDHELAAPALGIPVTRYKLGTFMLYAFLTAIAGSLGAVFVGNVSTDSYTLTITISYVVMVLIGGLDSVTGSLIGAFIITLLPTFVSDETTALFGSSFAASYGSAVSEGIYGLAILVLVTAGRAGLAGLGNQLWHEISVRISKRRRGGISLAGLPTPVAPGALSASSLGEGFQPKPPAAPSPDRTRTTH